MIFKRKIERPSLRTEVLKKEKFNVLDCIYRLYFRKFLIVKIVVGKELYFRFYDPCILRIILPTCNKHQMKNIFGPIQKFSIENEKSEEAIEFTIENGQLLKQKIAKETFWKNLNCG